MTHEEAERIFKSWQDFQEIHNKLSVLFMSSIPESFLPYPKNKIMEAIEIVAESVRISGNKKNYDIIWNSSSYIVFYKDDGEAIEGMSKYLNMMESDKNLKASCLKNMKEARESWLKFRMINNY